MDIPAISCPSCNANVESANHVFFECDIATDMWKLVFRWCDILLFQASSWDSFNDWIISWHASKEKKHRFYVITTSVLWWLWRYRNSVTFNSQPLRKSDIFDNVRFSSFLWLHNRDHMKLSWNDWLMEQEDALFLTFIHDPAPQDLTYFHGNVEEVAREVEEVAEVVEKVASTTEKISAEVAEKLDNGELKQVALMVEHVSTIIAKDARMTEEFIHKVGDLKQDITDLENMVEHAIDKTKKMEVKIKSTQFIKPSKSTPENLRSYKLSRLDQLALPSYINQVYYYKPSGDINILDTCGQLVKSLSEVLTLFYPLAGRITEEGLKVDCSDQGVKFIETKVTTRLDDFLNKGPKIDHVKQLIGISDQDTTTLVIVQLNVFDCGALVIGVSASHKVTDAYNLVRFINQWASTNRTGCISDAFCPTFDNLASLFQPRVISSMEQSHVTNEPLPKIVTKRYVFNGSIISKLKEKAGSDYGKHSRVTLVAALIWKALISVDQLKSGSLRNCILAPAINLRGKIGLTNIR
ncbi:acetyl-CoA-benzylalcohol acetyltransferase-like protein [Tanacetum coccineum]